MSGRDPRVEPRAGDVLRKGRRQRMVRRTSSDVVVTHEAQGVIVYSSPAQWRRWAAGSEVVRVAEEVSEP